LFLVDDLIAELDAKHQTAVAQLLSQQEGQVLVTGTDEKLLKALWQKGYGKVFHVEQGSVKELEK
jgi:recombinational DNA repair ATPase RecF